jgi:hypothetical protein
MCTHVRQNFWKVSSNSEHHSKPTMNINSQHHKLLGNQISPKSEDLFIWGPFCTLVTMATVAILIFSTLQKLPHTRVDIPTKWIILWLPNHWYQFPTSKSTWKPNFAQIGGFFVFGSHCIPWLPWQRPPFWILTILHHLGCFNCNQQLIETLLAW